jgi:hypothetical protein
MVLVQLLYFFADVPFRPRFFHRIGDPVGIQDGAAIDVAGSAATAHRPTVETSPVGIQNRHHDTSTSSPSRNRLMPTSIESAQPQVTQNLDPLNGFPRHCAGSAPRRFRLQVIGCSAMRLVMW